MDYDPHPELPEYMRVPVDFSLYGLIEYINGHANRLSVSDAVVRIFMSQTQLYSSEEFGIVSSALSVDALWQVHQSIASNSDLWLGYAPVVELFEHLDKEVVMRCREAIDASSGMANPQMDLLFKALVCISYRRSFQQEEAWQELLFDMFKIGRSKWMVSSISDELPRLVKNYFDENVMNNKKMTELEKVPEPPILHPLMGTIKTGVDAVKYSHALNICQQTPLKKVLQVLNDNPLTASWREVSEQYSLSTISNKQLGCEIENFSSSEMSDLLIHLFRGVERPELLPDITTLAVILEAIYEQLIAHIVERSRSSVSRSNAISHLHKLLNFFTHHPTLLINRQIIKDLERLFSKSLITEREYSTLKQLLETL